MLGDIFDTGNSGVVSPIRPPTRPPIKLPTPVEEPTTERPTTEQPTTEQPTTEDKLDYVAILKKQQEIQSSIDANLHTCLTVLLFIVVLCSIAFGLLLSGNIAKLLRR